MLHFRGYAMPAHIVLTPDVLPAIVADICGTRLVAAQAARVWMSRGGLKGAKELKGRGDSERDGKWSTTWGDLVQALQDRAIPPARRLDKLKAQPVLQSAGTRTIEVTMGGPLLGAAEALAADAGVDVQEILRRALSVAATDAGLLSALGAPRKG